MLLYHTNADFSTYIKNMFRLQYVLVQVLPEGRFWEMISFEFHPEKWHEKNQKPLWFLGFPNRYLFRCAMLVAEVEPLPHDLRAHKARDVCESKNICFAK